MCRMTIDWLLSHVCLSATDGIRLLLLLLAAGLSGICGTYAADSADYLRTHCHQCHDEDSKQGGLDLTALKPGDSSPENFARWVRIHDRLEAGEMPPKSQPRPPESATAEVLRKLKADLIAAERSRLDGQRRTGVRRLTRAEYENTIRDLFDMPGIALDRKSVV